MSWDVVPEFDAGQRAALNSGKPLVYVCPPAAWAARPLFDRLTESGTPDPQTLALVPDPSAGFDLAEALAGVDPLPPIAVATGIARAARRLALGSVRTLIATPADALQLVGQARLAPAALARIAILWPEAQLALGMGDAIDAVLTDAAAAQRLVVTADERQLGDFLERHARRAPTVVAARPPNVPTQVVRYAAVDRARLEWAAAVALDILNPATALIWDPSPLRDRRWSRYDSDPTVRVGADPGSAAIDLALAVELPTGEALEVLAQVARDLVVLVRPGQLGYLERLARSLRPLRLPSEADRAREQGVELRRRVRTHLDEAFGSAELQALGPLMDEYDPALVAAAALRAAAGVASAPPGAAEPAAPQVPAWVRIRIDAGRRDQLRTGDVVGALLNAVGLPKHHVGRVDLRERFTIVEVRAEMAEQARRGLDGLLLRGKRVAARIDHH